MVAQSNCIILENIACFTEFKEMESIRWYEEIYYKVGSKLMLKFKNADPFHPNQRITAENLHTLRFLKI